MIASGLFATPGIQGLSLSLDEAALRQQAISSNIANINTPGYQRVDVSSSFENAVQSALSDLSKGDPVGSMPAPSITTASQQGPARPDGNTVQLESEMLGLTQNSAKYEFASEMIANNFHGMKTAITGNVN